MINAQPRTSEAPIKSAQDAEVASVDNHNKLSHLSTPPATKVSSSGQTPNAHSLYAQNAAKNEPKASTPDKQGGGVGSFLYSLFVEDFVNAAKGIFEFNKGVYSFAGKALLAAFQLCTFQPGAAEATLKSGFEDLKRGGQALLDNAVSIVFAALTVASIATTGGAAVAGVIALRALMKQGAKVLFKEIGKQILEHTGVTAMKELFKDGLKSAGKKIGNHLVDSVLADGVRMCSWIGMSKFLPLAKDVALKSEKIGEFAAKLTSRELLEAGKVVARDARIADNHIDAMRSVVKANPGEKASFSSLSDAVEQASQIGKGSKVGDVETIAEVTESVEDKTFKLLHLIDEGHINPNHVKTELKSMGFLDSEVDELSALITDRKLRVGLHSGVYDKVITDNIIGAMQRESRKVIAEKITTGEIGKTYHEKMEKYLDSLVDSGHINKSEADLLKQKMKDDYAELYTKSFDEGIETGVNKAMRRFRSGEQRDDVASATPQTSKKKKTLVVAPPVVTPRALDSRSEQGVSLDASEEGRYTGKLVERNVSHWLNDYFKEREKSQQPTNNAVSTQNGKSADTEFKVSATIVEQIDQIGKMDELLATSSEVLPSGNSGAH